MKPSGAGASASFIVSGADLSPEAQALTAQDRYNELVRQQTLEMQAMASRSKLKTRRLLELCGQVTQSVRRSEAWFAKFEKFSRSPAWKLVCDETIRGAHFKCEYCGCTRLAKQVDLLEFPEEHLPLNSDWMKNADILIALCSHHHEMMHGFIMKRVVTSVSASNPLPSSPQSKAV